MAEICGGRMTATQEQLDQWHAEHTESLRWLEPIYAEWERRRLSSIARINAEHLNAQEERRLREDAELTAWAVERAEHIAWRNSPAGRAEAERERAELRMWLRARKVEERARRVRALSREPGVNVERDRRIYRQRLAGASWQALEYEYGLCRQRLRDIVELQGDIDDYRKARYRREPGRVIDMGGPRDVWLTWTPEMQAHEFGIA